MLYPVNRLTAMVRTAMGINRHDHPLVHCRDPDRATLDDMISQALLTVAARTYSEASLAELSECARAIDPDTIYWHAPVEGTYGGHIFLPDDYMRLLVFEMSDWSMPVVSPIGNDSGARNAFYSAYASLRGTCDKPKCLVTNTSEGHCLIFNSCRTVTATIVQAKYIPRPSIDCHGGLSLPRALLSTIITATAAMIRPER